MGQFVTAADVLRDAAERINEENWVRGQFKAVEYEGTGAAKKTYGCAMGHLAIALASLRTGDGGTKGGNLSADAVEDLRTFEDENMEDNNPTQYSSAAQYLAKILDAKERGLGIQEMTEDGEIRLANTTEAISRIIEWNDRDPEDGYGHGASDWMEIQVALKEAAELAELGCSHEFMKHEAEAGVTWCQTCGYTE